MLFFESIEPTAQGCSDYVKKATCIGVFPKWKQEFSEFSEFRESY